MTCRTCHWSEYAHPFGLWCRLFNAKAQRVCDGWQREPGAEE